MTKVVGTFGLGESFEGFGDCAEDGLFGSGFGLAQSGFEFGEELLDGIEVGRIGRQEEKIGAGTSDGCADGTGFVAAQIIDDDDIAGLKRRDQGLFDIGTESDAIDRSIEQNGGIDTIIPQCCQEGACAPFAERRFGQQPLAFGRPAAQTRHVGLDPGLVDEDEATWIETALISLPARAFARHVGSILFGGVKAFF